jgi:hypothetical protein
LKVEVVVKEVVPKVRLDVLVQKVRVVRDRPRIVANQFVSLLLPVKIARKTNSWLDLRYLSLDQVVMTFAHQSVFLSLAIPAIL